MGRVGDGESGRETCSHAPRGNTPVPTLRVEEGGRYLLLFSQPDRLRVNILSIECVIVFSENGPEEISPLEALIDLIQVEKQ